MAPIQPDDLDETEELGRAIMERLESTIEQRCAEHGGRLTGQRPRELSSLLSAADGAGNTRS